MLKVVAATVAVFLICQYYYYLRIIMRTPDLYYNNYSSPSVVLTPPHPAAEQSQRYRVRRKGTGGQQRSMLVRTGSSTDDKNSKTNIQLRGNTNDNSNRDHRQKRKKKKGLAIVGITKDNAVWLDHFRDTVVRVLLNTSHIWELRRMIIYENDSTDGTPDIIKRWNCTTTTQTTNNTNTTISNNQNGHNGHQKCIGADHDDDVATRLLGGKVELISERLANVRKVKDVYAGSNNNKGRMTSSGRTMRLAHGRNRILERLRQLQPPLSIDYVLSLDMDEVNVGLRGVETCFSEDDGSMLPPGWGACCANQYGHYYDLWALRTSPRRNRTVSTVDNLFFANSNGRDDYLYEEWLQCDIYADCHDGWRRALRHIPANHRGPIRVHSCFGGAVVYDASYYLRTGNARYRGAYPPSRYDPLLAGKETTEHFLFHQDIHEAAAQHGRDNFTMYIQPKMLNDGCQEYTEPDRPEAEEIAITKSHNDPALSSYYDFTQIRPICESLLDELE